MKYMYIQKNINKIDNYKGRDIFNEFLKIMSKTNSKENINGKKKLDK